MRNSNWFRSTVKKIAVKIPGVWELRLKISEYRAPFSVVIRNKYRIKQLKGVYEGKRCFIIGNGPSLKASDLDKIKEEYSFAANRICNIFPETEWRPTFYCIQDENTLREMEEENIAKTAETSKFFFIRMHSFHIVKDKLTYYNDPIFVPISQINDKEGNARFSIDANKEIYDGDNVTYMSIQLAAYMGFKKIFLLGVDHRFPYIWTEDGKLIVNDLSVASHFYDGAENNVGERAYLRRGTNPVYTTNGYKAAEEYSRRHGFRIYNATRGGALEVFERVDLDHII